MQQGEDEERKMNNRQRTDGMITNVNNARFKDPNWAIFAVLVPIAQNLAEIADSLEKLNKAEDGQLRQEGE